MNKSYRSVWNEATGTWVAVQENAVARGKKKSKGKVLAALGVASVGAIGFMLPGAAWADVCVTSSGNLSYGYRSNGASSGCASWGSGVYGDVPGTATATLIGSGSTYMDVSSSQSKIMFTPGSGATLTMAAGASGNVLLSGVSAGLSGTDAVNVNQLTPVINALGGGASFNSSTGAVTGPTFTLTNANSITGQTGSQTTVGNAFSEVDAALGKLNSAITNMSGGTSPDAVLYDSSAHTSVTLGGTGASAPVALHNVANGTLSATSTDAVNGSQLYATNTNVSNLAGNVTTMQGNISTLSGNVTSINGQITSINGKLNDAVLYDSSAHNSVTLGGTGASAPVALHNVANGALSATSLDAVNGSQLYATNTNVSNLAGNVTTMQGNISTLSGDVTSINGQITNINGKLNDAVLYDSSAHNSVTLGGTGATSAVALHNVANGALSASSLDAVNGSQLYATNTNVSNLAGNVTTIQGNISTLSGDVTTINGQITNMQGQLADAVLYDSSAHNSVTLGGTGATSAVALHNVANGALSATSLDAVN
uniref:ESPR-type extended signal peptide-containing protein n=1 Tax=Paraburkholderia sp. J7 TaxID=2805438 RepID=UPI002AB673B4